MFLLAMGSLSVAGVYLKASTLHQREMQITVSGRFCGFFGLKKKSGGTARPHGCFVEIGCQSAGAEAIKSVLSSSLDHCRGCSLPGLATYQPFDRDNEYGISILQWEGSPVYTVGEAAFSAMLIFFLFNEIRVIPRQFESESHIN